MRFHANGIEIKVFDFKLIDSAVIKYFNCVYNCQIYNFAETKLNKIFDRVDHFWNLVRMVLYKVSLTNDMECILSFTVVFFFKVISVLTPQGTNWRKDFKVRVFNNSLMIRRTPSRASQSTYIRTDWLNYVRTIELTDPLKDKINRQPDWLASQSSFNLLHVSMYRSENKWVQVHFATLWIFTTCYLKINNKQIE